MRSRASVHSPIRIAENKKKQLEWRTRKWNLMKFAAAIEWHSENRTDVNQLGMLIVGRECERRDRARGKNMSEKLIPRVHDPNMFCACYYMPPQFVRFSHSQRLLEFIACSFFSSSSSSTSSSFFSHKINQAHEAYVRKALNELSQHTQTHR